MKKQRIIIVVASILLLATSIYFIYSLIPKKEKEKELKITSIYWNDSKDKKEIICTKKANETISGKIIDFLEKTEYHIEYDENDVVTNEYYQYYFIYPTKEEYSSSQYFLIEDDIGNVETFEDELVILDTHYIINKNDFIFDGNTNSKEAEEAYQKYLSNIENKYDKVVNDLKEQGYTCK